MSRIWFVIVCCAMSVTAFAADSRQAVENALNKQIVRGGIVFKAYCVLCHGEIGDGKSRASKLYGPRKLTIQTKGMEETARIIRLGGAAVGKSPFMPVWQDELSDEQISDVVAYLNVINTSEQRGEVVFKTNCILCHGIAGDGNGRAAKLYHPPPADLTHSDKNDEYKAMIIRLGGEAMGRSSVMPVWSDQLTDQEILDVVAYLRTLLVTKK